MALEWTSGKAKWFERRLPRERKTFQETIGQPIKNERDIRNLPCDWKFLLAPCVLSQKDEWDKRNAHWNSWVLRLVPWQGKFEVHDRSFATAEDASQRIQIKLCVTPFDIRQRSRRIKLHNGPCAAVTGGTGRDLWTQKNFHNFRTFLAWIGGSEINRKELYILSQVHSNGCSLWPWFFIFLLSPFFAA